MSEIEIDFLIGAVQEETNRIWRLKGLPDLDLRPRPAQPALPPQLLRWLTPDLIVRALVWRLFFLSPASVSFILVFLGFVRR